MHRRFLSSCSSSSDHIDFTRKTGHHLFSVFTHSLIRSNTSNLGHLTLLYLSLLGSLPFFRRFSYEEIKRATGGFSRIIGNHIHGAVYKAQFQDGFVAIVKEMKDFHHVFYREVKLLADLHHRHLVALRGFSMGPERFLVFENSENGSLKDHLNDPLKTPLSWRTRMEIAIGVAAALEYLQFFCEPPMSHVSINSSNVLLDEKFVAKKHFAANNISSRKITAPSLSQISEVGLLCSTESHIASSLNSRARGNICTVLAVTRSCIDQEGKDVVFQLGVLILELITGQSEKEGTDLVLWVQGPDLAHSVSRMIDPDVENSYNSKELRRLLTVARLCTKSRGKQTCSFQQILRFLQGKLEPCLPQV
ncbi:hypothetical protein IFM89_006219 [Coptis chinensis]|uniref:Protein kinase domain-containing protein n=1 Tax=Coptis chinensis TaxID=261450 RepID=A0A835HD44_9MAGN|nr:hypothetical protein IFM89_006219 [Coptis chinensis]